LIKELEIKIRNQNMRVKHEISSIFELNKKIKKKNQIHERIKKISKEWGPNLKKIKIRSLIQW